MDWGIKVTRDGFDITSIDPLEYILNSAYSSVKIALSGSGSILVNANSSATATIAHGLSFTPMALFFVELSPGSSKWFIGVTRLSAGDADAGDIQILSATDGNSNPTETYTDGTNLKITFKNNHASNNYTVSYYYFIFGDSGT